MMDTARGQRLYDKKRDEKAQEAKTLSEGIKSGSLFNSQIRNLNSLSNQDVQTYFLDASRVLRANINRFEMWGKIREEVDEVSGKVGAESEITSEEVTRNLVNINNQKKDAEKALDDLKREADGDGSNLPDELFSRIGDLDPVLELAEKVLGEDKSGAAGAEAVQSLTETFKTLEVLYKSYKARLEEIDNLKLELDSLKVPLKKVALEMLQVEEDHWKTVGMITARRAAEQAEIRRLIRDFNERMKRLNSQGVMDDEYVDDTLNEAVEEYHKQSDKSERRKRRAALIEQVLNLYVAASIIAHGLSGHAGRTPASSGRAPLLDP